MTAGGDGPDGTGRAIALVHYAAPPVVGGVERVVARHAVLLADAGHDVRFIAGRGAAPDPRVRLVQITLADPRHPTIERLQEELDGGRVPAEFVRVVAMIAAELDVAFRGVDVVVAHNVCSLSLNLALTAAMRTVMDRPVSPRLILWHHDLAGASPRYRPTLHPGMPWDLLRTAWPGAVQVAVSEGRRSELAELVGVKADTITVVPNGVDLARMWRLDARTTELLARSDLFAAAPLLLMPARITPRKNIELGLRVVAEMRRAGRAAGVIVTGPADPHHQSGRAYLEQLVALRQELGLQDSAWFLADELRGPPPDAMMDDLYHLADVLFMPSRDEGFGLPILEAAVNRLPIVCSGLPALRELAGDAARYIEPDGDPAVIAAEILEGFDADRPGLLARAVRSRFTWEAVYRESIGPLVSSDTGTPRAR
jgi:glycosyltransferase involved in cell wall biosynthesis